MPVKVSSLPHPTDFNSNERNSTSSPSFHSAHQHSSNDSSNLNNTSNAGININSSSQSGSSIPKSFARHHKDNMTIAVNLLAAICLGGGGIAALVRKGSIMSFIMAMFFATIWVISSLQLSKATRLSGNAAHVRERRGYMIAIVSSLVLLIVFLIRFFRVVSTLDIEDAKEIFTKPMASSRSNNINTVDATVMNAEDGSSDSTNNNNVINNDNVGDDIGKAINSAKIMLIVLVIALIVFVKNLHVFVTRKPNK